MGTELKGDTGYRDILVIVDEIMLYADCYDTNVIRWLCLENCLYDIKVVLIRETDKDVVNFSTFCSSLEFIRNSNIQY